MIRIAIDWAPNTISGWGVFGMNLILALSDDPDVELIYPRGECYIDPLRAAAMNAVSQKSSGKVADVFVHALGNELQPEPETPRDRTIGMIFFEEPLSAGAIERAKRYPLIMCGSNWNTEMLRAAGANVITVHQGVDRTLFHPAGKLMGGRFAVFSGGKAEWRKGQDLVLKAFKIFADKHDDAVLVTAWHSPWPQLAKAIGAPLLENGDIDVVQWGRFYGIPEHQIMDLGGVHYTLMPQVYREMACAVFPNRAEGGTNLVAMEAMACGVPTFISDNTGHRDIVGCERMPQDKFDAIGRGETPIDEIFQALEWTYDVDEKHELKGFSWSDTAVAIKQACLSCLSQTASPGRSARPIDSIPGNEIAAMQRDAAESIAAKAS